MKWPAGTDTDWLVPVSHDSMTGSGQTFEKSAGTCRWPEPECYIA